MGNVEITFRVGGRRSGKTTRILEWLVENPDGVVICANHQQARILYDRAVREISNVRKDQFISHGSKVVRGLKGKVAIDEGQWILQMMYPNLDFVTATGELDD